MNNPNIETKKHNSMFREPWAWFVLSPLITVVLVSSVTVTIAVVGADDVVSDNYYRKGRMINHNFSASENAAALGIGGKLDFDRRYREIRFAQSTANANGILTETIRLYLSHPSEADRDITVVLQPVAVDAYKATLPREISGRWYVRLSGYETVGDSTELWRLDGEIDLNATSQLEFR